MQIRTDGLIIRELNVGESDRIVTVLTRDKGVVRASAKGARKPKSRYASACRLLCYSRLTLLPGKEKYILLDAEPLEVFMGVRSGLESLALSQYFSELSGTLAPRDEPAEPFLRLTLNAMHLLETQARPFALIKAAFEMRALTLAGYMPDLVACASCGVYEHEWMYLLPVTGALYCADCLPDAQCTPEECRRALPLSKGALAALRHSVYSEFEKLFAFTLGPKPLREFAAAAESYTLAQLDRTFPTLEFYRSVRLQPGTHL